MTKFVLTIDCDNPAFIGHCRDEMARILRETADQLEHGNVRDDGDAYDVNGNRVGEWRIMDGGGVA